MSERPETVRLSDDHCRHLLGVFTHVEELLESVETALRPSGSPFARTYPDVDREETALLESFIATARQRMVEACDRLGVLRPTPGVSARWSTDTALHFAEISFAEIQPGSMRGYGALPPRAADELAGVARELQQLMRRGMAILHPSDDGAAGDRRIERSGHEREHGHSDQGR